MIVLTYFVIARTSGTGSNTTAEKCFHRNWFFVIKQEPEPNSKADRYTTIMFVFSSIASYRASILATRYQLESAKKVPVPTSEKPQGKMSENLLFSEDGPRDC